MPVRIYLFIVLAAILGLSLQQCGADEFSKPVEIDYDANWGLPLGHLSYTIEELLAADTPEDLLLSKDENGTLLLRYSVEEEISIDVGTTNEVALPTTTASVQQTVNVPAPPNPPLVSVLPQQPAAFSHTSPVNTRLDSIVYKTGKLTLSARSTYAAHVQTKLSLPALSSPDHTPLEVSFALDYVGVSPVVLVEERNLVDYVLTLTSDAATPSVGSFSATFDNTLTQRSGESLRIGDEFSWTITFENTSSKTIYGHFGQEVIEFPERNQHLGEVFLQDISFVDAKLEIAIKNSYGIPLSLSFVGLAFVEGATTVHPLTGPPIENEHFIAAPKLDAVGQSVSTTIVINRANSNLIDVLGQKFTSINFPLVVKTNPPAPHPQYRDNFITDGNAINMAIHLDIPFKVTFQDIEMTETLDNPLKGIVLAEQYLNGIKLRILMESTLHMDLSLDIQFLSGGQVIHTVDRQFIRSFSADTYIADSNQPVQSIEDVALDGTAIERLVRADVISVTLRINSPQDGQGNYIASHLTDQPIDIHLSVIANAHLQSNTVK